MTESVLKEIVHRAVRDGAYRAQLRSDPAGALAGYSLTADERSAIASGDPTRLTALGIDQRMSKAFASGILGDASKVIIAYEPGAGGAVVDETAQTVRSPMWRLEQDLHPGEAAVTVEPETVRSPMWRIEQDLHGGEAALAPGSETVRSPMWRVEQDLYDANAARLDPEAAETGAALTTEVVDLNQDANWEGPQITEN
jgi:hypothetical protein